MEHEISATEPTLAIESNNPPTTFFPTWININVTKATLFLKSMKKPQRGLLIFKDNKWHFRHGNKSNNTTHLPDFYSTAHDLYRTFQLFEGQPKNKTISNITQQRELTNIIAHHVSARNLTSEDVHSLLQHRLLNDNDRRILDSAYAEEYFGLTDLPCWATITEAEFQRDRHLYKSILPSMAVSLIKCDEYGSPKRAKYRIVALGNLESHK